MEAPKTGDKVLLPDGRAAVVVEGVIDDTGRVCVETMFGMAWYSPEELRHAERHPSEGRGVMASSDRVRLYQQKEADEMIERLVVKISGLSRRLDAVNLAKLYVEDTDSLRVEHERLEDELTSASRSFAEWLQKREAL